MTRNHPRRLRRAALAIAASLAIAVATLTAAQPATAVEPAAVQPAIVTVTAATPTQQSVTFAYRANGMDYYKVCSPKKCVTIASSKYCPISSGCSKAMYKPWPTGVYCSSSVGCFTIGGKNYSYIGGPIATPEQQLKAAQCAIGIGFTAVTAGAGGPVGVTVGGVILTVWGCL